MSVKWLLTVTAIVECGTGLLLLNAPGLVLDLLLRMDQVTMETALIARLAGAALVTVSLMAWFARIDQGSPSLRGLIYGLLFYNGAAAVILGLAGVTITPIGILLWPAVVFHLGMTIWCLAYLRSSTAKQ